jgi:hypothetical protein
VDGERLAVAPEAPFGLAALSDPLAEKSSEVIRCFHGNSVHLIDEVANPASRFCERRVFFGFFDLHAGFRGGDLDAEAARLEEADEVGRQGGIFHQFRVRPFNEFRRADLAGRMQIALPDAEPLDRNVPTSQDDSAKQIGFPLDRTASHDDTSVYHAVIEDAIPLRKSALS